jgi:hypothetical protein
MKRFELSLLSVVACAISIAGCSIDVTGRAILNPDGGVDMSVDMARPDLGRDMFVPPDGNIDMPLDEGVDQGVDLGLDIDLGVDVDMFVPVDMGLDAGLDASADLGFDAGIDLGVDAGVDAGVDLGTDLGVDLGFDAGPSCLASDAASCFDATTLLTCPGGTPTFTTCALGCSSTPSPQCRVILPSNIGPVVSISDSTADLNTGSITGMPYWLFDTESGQILAYDTGGTTSTEIRAGVLGLDHGIRFTRRPASGAGSDLGVFVVNSLVIAEGTTVVATGPRAFVLLAARSVDIRGALLVNANVIPGMPGPGPGGQAGGANETAGGGTGGGLPGSRAALGNDDSGGGGAGFGSAGGSGGAPSVLLAGGGGGVSYGSLELIPLRAGAGGAGGGDDDGGAGGAGGGAVQISATDFIRITAAGYIDASGAGGQGGRATMSTMDSGAGGGGGSGGAVLLEAAIVTIDGRVGANGGAGGQGATAATTPGASGANGSAMTVPALGADTSGLGGSGGAGSDASGVAQNGGAQENGGGGGGGPGRIRVNNYAGSFTFGSGVSPNASSGLATSGPAAATP